MSRHNEWAQQQLLASANARPFSKMLPFACDKTTVLYIYACAVHVRACTHTHVQCVCVRVSLAEDESGRVASH